MKNNNRKILVALLLVFVMMMGIFSVTSFAEESAQETKTYYFSNNQYWEKVYVYYWTDGGADNSWPGVEANYVCVNDFGETIYSIDVPADKTHIIFNNNNNGEQTVDIKLSGYATNGFYPDKLAGKNSEGKWPVGTYSFNNSNTGGGTDNPPATAGSYTVAGEAVLCGSEWNTTDTYNDMTLNPDTGLYEKTFTGIPTGTYKCKVVVNHSWTESYGGTAGEYGDYSFTLDQEYNVTITFNPTTKTVGHYTSASTGATPRPEPEKPEINYDETIRIYLNDIANWGNPRVYCWTIGAIDQNAIWPGVEMEWDGDKQLYYADIPTYYQNIIFTDGNSEGAKTDDLKVPGTGYYFDNGSKEWLPLDSYVPPIPPVNTTEDVTVYVKDGAHWGNVYIYFWDENGVQASVWPGVEMELGEDGYYFYTIPSGFSNVIFNNGKGEGENIQTENLNIPKDGKVYIDNSNQFLTNDSQTDGDKAWYSVGSNSGDNNNQGGNQDNNNQGGNQGDDTQTEQPKAELTFLQKLAYKLLLFLRSIEGFFKNMFAGNKA